MSITINRYVNITSGVAAANAVAARELIGRLFTNNDLLPPQTIAHEFTSAEGVGDYFGFESDEYKRALFYFSWVSKNITKPQKISFSRWVSSAAAPRIYGEIKSQVVASWAAISDGSFKLTINGTTNTFTGVDFTGAGSLAAVATIIETKIRTASGTMWTAAVVTYNADRGSFDFVGGEAVATSDIYAEAGTSGTSIAAKMGWLSGSTLILANGSAIETITQTLTTSADLSNNFGSFLFLSELSIDEITEAAIWNNTTPQNVTYQYCVPVAKDDAEDYYDALANYGGVGVTISETEDEFPEMVPMMILAATNYQATNSVQNYMFQQFELTPSVITNEDADTFDALRTNYYGQTQSAGRTLSFYQRGLLMGTDTDPLDMNTYANEQWLKDAATVVMMNLMLALTELSANAQGRSQILAALQSVVNIALINGTISVGKPLNSNQKAYITQLSGDSNAWYQVQNNGYWMDVVIIQVDDEWQATYTLIYSKDDAIRKVNGSHILI